MANVDYKLIVIPGTWDDLGVVLDGLDYKHEDLDIGALADYRRLSNCRVVFVPCGLRDYDDERVLKNLRQFVERGGAMYVSDLSHNLIDALFPGKVLFFRKSYDSDITGEILDPGLSEIIGRSIQLHMDMPDAAAIDHVSQDVQVLVEGKRGRVYEGKYPFLISFRHGEGQVIYTVFHNSHQVNETEKKLLNYLVFRPIMSGAATKAAAVVKAQMASPGKEIFASINPGETSSRYGLNVTSPINILFVLSWEENATLGMQIWDPSGKLVQDGSSGKSPFTIEITASQPGTWTCAIKGQSVPHHNFPYVLTLATRGGKPVPAKPTVVMPTAPAALPAQYLPIYLVVDASSRTKDFISPLVTGLRYFGDQLRGRAYGQVSAAVSLLLANEAGKVTVPLTEARRFSLPPIGANGKCWLAPALENIQSSIASSTKGVKPLVLVLLAGAPEDNWHNQADRLRELAASGKVNVFVFGVGGYADGSVLRRLAPASALSFPIITQAYVQQIFDWLYSITDVIINGSECGASGKRSIPNPPSCLRSLD